MYHIFYVFKTGQREGKPMADCGRLKLTMADCEEKMTLQEGLPQTGRPQVLGEGVCTHLTSANREGAEKNIA